MTRASAAEPAPLESFAILRDIAPQRLRQTLAASSEYQLELPPGTLLLDAGEVKPGLYLIARGIVELFVCDAQGKENVVDFARAGGTLAEETLFNEQPLQYSARSLSTATVFFLPNDLVSEWIERYPAFARRLISLVAERIDFLSRDVFTFRTKRATSRLVCYILCHFNKAPMAADGSYSLSIEIPHNKLASRLGVSASQVSRSLRELQERGLIVAQEQGYFIPDVPALSKYVCPRGCDF
jgi:CRP-like cAMP-binding protein